MRAKFAVAALAFLAGFVGPASAQGPNPVRWPRPTFASMTWSTPAGVNGPSVNSMLAQGAGPADTARIPPTHWKTGAIIGGATLGLLGAVVFVGACGFDHPCHRPVWYGLGGFALGGVLGFGIGALIGGQFPAHSP